MKISAVVVTYNRKEILLDCLKAILSQTCPADQIYIVDNASTDGTEQALDDNGFLENPQIEYIRLKTNTGGAGGFYCGSKQAYRDGADWIWMMDDDCIPSDSALYELVEASKIVDASFLNSAQFSERGEYVRCVGVNYFGEGLKYLSRGIVSISYAPFVSFFVSREAVNVCGLPYKDFFIYGDDTEYSKRLITHYKPGYLVGKSIVVHGKGVEGGSPWDTSDKERIQRGRYIVRNLLVNAKAYGGRKGRILKHLRNIRLLLNLLFGKQTMRLYKIREVLIGYWGYWTGTYDRKAFKNRFHNHEE